MSLQFPLPFLFPVGPVVVSKSPPPLSEMERSFMEVKAGGRGWPADCIARHRVAIIIPFRDRPQHLQTLLYNMHPILLRQQIEYQIFVIEQEGKSTEKLRFLVDRKYFHILCDRIIFRQTVNNYFYTPIINFTNLYTRF